MKIVHINAQRFIPPLPSFTQHWQVVPFPTRLMKLFSWWLMFYSPCTLLVAAHHLQPHHSGTLEPPQTHLALSTSPCPVQLPAGCWTEGRPCCKGFEPHVLHGEASILLQSLFVPPLRLTTSTELGTTPCLLKPHASVRSAQETGGFKSYTWGRRDRQLRKTV